MVALIAAVIGLGYAMRGSMRRLREREATGTFGTPHDGRDVRPDA